jgi:molecular chaperone GrpE
MRLFDNVPDLERLASCWYTHTIRDNKSKSAGISSACHTNWGNKGMFFNDTNDTVNNQNEEITEDLTKKSAQERSANERAMQEHSMREHAAQESASQEFSEQELASQELAPQELTQQKIAQQELALCKLESAQWKEQYLRARADFENYTKRVEKERSNLVLFAQTQVLLDLIAVVDDFDRALAEEQKDASAEIASWRSGIQMIRASLGKVLETYGVKPMADYVVFNPELHEAISQLAVEGKASGAIVHVAQKGYLRNGVVLRPAKVVVAQ